jgi:DNA polymerase-4
MDRQIVCVGIPSVEVAVARLHDPALRTRPLAIAPLNTPRALLREISLEAQQDGLMIGMPLDYARRLCPSLAVLSPNPQRARYADDILLRTISRYAPVWEPAHPGTFVLDVTGTGKLFGPACDVAATVQQEVLSHAQLDGVAGVGSNKLVAQTAATLMAPSELYDVRPGSEQVFMSPLSVRTIPGLHRPCMQKVFERLDALNLLTLGEVAECPLDALEVVLGDYAGQLSRWAQGIDHLPVLSPAVQPCLDDAILVEPDAIDDSVLWGQLRDGLQRLCRTLRNQRRVCGSIALLIRYSDQVEVTKRERLATDTCWECDLTPVLLSLFQRCFTRRIRLRQMTISLSGLTGYAEQIRLFDDRPAEEQRRQARTKHLAVALDQLHARFGERAIRYGRSQ